MTAAAPLTSMTGFARVDGAHGDRRWTWEARSVNGRGLDVRLRLPSGFDRIEADLKRVAGELLTRGNVTASLQIVDGEEKKGLAINVAGLDAALRAVRHVQEAIDCDRPRPEGILALRGVLETADEIESDAMRAEIDAALVASFRAAMTALRESRRKEGAAILPAFKAQLAEIEKLRAAAAASAAASPAALRNRLQAQIAELAGAVGVDDARLAQEAALLAVKADIREELDRLKAHVAAALDLLASGEAVGRRLDFLTQEFNREANTLCAKVQDIDLKRLGLDLKTVIDQFREQVQNIE